MKKNTDPFRKGRADVFKASAKWKPVINSYRIGRFKKDGIRLSQRDVMDYALEDSHIEQKTRMLLKQLREQGKI